MSHADWHTDAFPELRSGPPWVMQEMIVAQPELVAAILSSAPSGAGDAAGAITAALSRGQPVTICGCGTSEHAAHGIAALLAAAVEPVGATLLRAKPALSAALDPTPGVCLGVSHDGGTRATELALLAARRAGATTIAITHAEQGSVARAADHVLLTSRHDESWCHTLAYTSALAVGAGLAGQVGRLPADPVPAQELLTQAAAAQTSESIAAHLADRRVVLCAGALVDHVTARELSLKLAEGARMPTLALELETVVHGQMAAHESADGLILVALTDHPERDRIARRAAHVARAAAAIGLSVAGLVSRAFDQALAPDLTPAGRQVIDLPDPATVDPVLAGLLAGAGALQSLTLALAHARQTNPDLIRREEAPYRQAAQEAESAADW